MKCSYLLTGGVVLIVGLSGLMWWLVTSALQTSALQTSALQTSALQSSEPFPLNMAPDAVDDMYDGCREKMETVIDTYFKDELVGNFSVAWKRAESCSKKRHPEDEDLTKNHMQAICAYTSNNIYEEFNNAVRTGKKTYTSSFKFHSLHFWLTRAIQILNKKQECRTSYRRTKVGFNGKLHSIIRFGTFASSSKLPDLTRFGSKTCFKIKSCLGAYLKDYSSLNRKEEEVLIPPYEIFQITNIKGKGKRSPMPDCEKVFILESKGIASYLNCKAAKK
ncbi:NAD(P)(+)--arginine ADP-ribosyltransferase 2-like [Scomber scombrus]|uniref:NAD(P)(+)--arginine ADP-ribosyltransferase 2-like n=1 Tax=Scomber scombrus TaxID=13677 RepID=UPI002DD932C5|nr:NAD(P)(+)--arginine ADP-ribosyltransferase 2-like [Scomber scombrus]